jgi:guanylate kinase
VEQQLEKGFHVILDIEIQGARQVREKMPEAVSVFIVPPSMAELRRRLETRGTDTKEVIDARIARARQEIQEADFYDYLIINDDAALAADRFRAILTAEQCRFDRPTLLRLAE